MSCTTATVYQPFETSLINYRSTLVLDTTPQPPLSEAQALQLVADLEARLLASPHIGPAIKRAEFHQRFDSNFKLADDYRLLSDTLSVVGISDREQTSRIGKATETEFLLGVQAFSVPCATTCVEGSQAAVVGQMIDSHTGVLVWRATLLRSVDDAPASVNAALATLGDELVELFHRSVHPKWQRQRFRNLSPPLANLPRPSIPLPETDRSRITIGVGAPGATNEAP